MTSFAKLGFYLALACTASCTKGQESRKGIKNHSDQLEMIAGSVLNYRAYWHEFPPAVVIGEKKGDALHSWRVLLLPFIEANDFVSHYDFEIAWNGDANADLLSGQRVSEGDKFKYPASVRRVYHRSGTGSESDTDFVMVAIGGTPIVNNFRRLPKRTNMKCSAYRGEIDTKIILVELEQSGIHWMRPQDIYLGDSPIAEWLPYRSVRDRVLRAAIIGSKVTLLDRESSLAFLDRLDRAVMENASTSKIFNDYANKKGTLSQTH